MQMMSVKQYASKMASSESQIRQMCADGIIPSVKIGKGYKIDVDRADEYFAREINKRMAEAKRKDERKVMRVPKTKKSSSFLGKLDELLKGVGENVKQNRICSIADTGCE